LQSLQWQFFLAQHFGPQESMPLTVFFVLLAGFFIESSFFL